MGVSSEVATAVAEKAVLGKPTKIKILLKKPMLCQNTQQGVEVNDSSALGTKRKPEVMLECQKGKRLRMDQKATSHCLNILTKLMKNRFSKPFLEPVDPVKWGIMDYFDIIKHPMDLGTIRRKLQQNSYIDSEEFEADVRLTLSNAMLYNPPHNWVHQHAKILNGEFNGLWKSIRAILFRDLQNVNKHNYHQDVQSKSDRVEAFPGNGRLHKESPKKVSVAMSRSDLKGFKDCKVKDAMLSRCNPGSAGLVPHQDKETFCSVSVKVARENANGDKVLVKESNVVKVKNLPPLPQSRSDQHSMGVASSVNEEHAPVSFPVTTDSLGTTTILEAELDIQLSPSKALRAAKLRSRYADIIIKAQNKLQPEKDGGFLTIFLKEEKERLLKKQQEEKARIEAQVKAAELAARLKVKGELKKQREQARASLEKMERSTEFDDNSHALKQLEALMGSSLFGVCHNSRHSREWNEMRSDKLGSPLERLGLYLKAEYRVGDVNEDMFISLKEMDLEEGEVI